MEKYYSVKPGSDLYNHWFEFDKNREKLKTMLCKFCEEVGIESKNYGSNGIVLYIISTESDADKYGTQLAKKIYEGGARAFKKNSKVNKAWVKRLEENNYELIEKPQMWHYFGANGRVKSRIFDDEKGNVYCSLDAEYRDKDNPDVVEIKASEFFKVIEEIQEKSA